MKPLGECDLQVKHNGQRLTLKFQVMKHKCKPLLSAETCDKLQLIQLNISAPESVHQMNESPVEHCLSKEELLSKYREVFSGLGHIGDAKIVIDKSATPVQHSPRRVPVALQKDVRRRSWNWKRKELLRKQLSLLSGSATWWWSPNLRRFGFVWTQKI